MTYTAINHITFPDRFNPLTERRTTARAWVNALKPFFRFVNITPVEEGGNIGMGVVADNGENVVITLTPSTTVRGRYGLWDAEVYFRSLQVGRLTQVGNLNDLLTFVTRDI